MGRDDRVPLPCATAPCLCPLPCATVTALRPPQLGRLSAGAVVLVLLTPILGAEPPLGGGQAPGCADSGDRRLSAPREGQGEVAHVASSLAVC